MSKIKIIAFTHKTTDMNNIGKLHLEETTLQGRLEFLKQVSGVDELMYLSTCNRVEFILSSNKSINNTFLKKFFAAFNPAWTELEVNQVIENAQVFEGDEAFRHLFSVASSIDSLVVG